MGTKSRLENFMKVIANSSVEDDLRSLLELQNDGSICLYAGTYSFAQALERNIDYDTEAQFYFYVVPHKKGYLYSINRFGKKLIEDNDIFKFSHRSLYNKKHLSNCYFGEEDCRSGEYFNDGYFPYTETAKYLRSKPFKGEIAVNEHGFKWIMGEIKLEFYFDCNEVTVICYGRRINRFIEITHFHCDKDSIIHEIDNINSSDKMVVVGNVFGIGFYKTTDKNIKKKKSFLFYRHFYSE